MQLTKKHISVALVATILLHATLLASISRSQPAPPLVAEKPPLRVNLLATIDQNQRVITAEPAPGSAPAKKKPDAVVKKTPPRPKASKPHQTETVSVQKRPEPVKPTNIVKQNAKNTAERAEITPTRPDAAATARYEQLLVAWLEKHKKYPRRARRLRIEGEVILRILINHSGQTLKVSLEQSTGNRLLDKAALEMATRANPFPPMPKKDPAQQLEFLVPVAFFLR